MLRASRTPKLERPATVGGPYKKQEEWVVNVYGEQEGGSKDFGAGWQEL